MPHDMGGRLIRVESTIVSKPYNQPQGENRRYAGTVVDIHNDAQSCTGQMKYVDCRGEMQQDYFGADESLIVLEPDGKEPTDENSG